MFRITPPFGLLTPLAALLLAALTLPVSHAAGLNDTGIVLCGNASNNNVDCSASDPVGYPRQDGRFGRAAMDAAGVLYKIGASSSLGFDYTKIANDGIELPADAILGSAAGQWACTRDNVTGLIWEVKVNDASHLRHMNHTYTWYSTDATSNGNNQGTQTSSTCNSTLSPANQCNTQNYVATVNALSGAARLCGAADWRLPTKGELHSLVDQSRQFSGSATIDATYFPNTPAWVYWSATNYQPNAAYAWGVAFDGGNDGNSAKNNDHGVRLVRGGQ